ncbi:MBL fold metallo-hydrolase [Psychrobacillus sp.]|uniref:MBL fold metallo-hydrolase n=1 Tax=Psychrobacillus sp. TaxID=1871623 RepID=UPI0028BF0A02|nr:MBL fold metallo-hydrolase [Psychrobacillus sp.]
MKKIVYLFTIVIAVIALLIGCTQPINEMEVPNTNVQEETTKGKEMKVHFIDVGQGDSIFIQSPNGKNMLIDGGKRDSGKEVVAFLRDLGVNKLDYVVATHPDADHIGGLLAVLNSISIKNFVDSGKVHTSQTYEKMLTLIQEKKIPFIVPANGDEISLDPAINITVLNAGEGAADNNEASIVLRVAYKDVSFLLTGDADTGVESNMMEQYNVESTILKAGHHGSNTSSSSEFIAAVKPEVSILSYGKDNSYGHPHSEVVSVLKKAGSQVYATAEAGNISVSTNGVDYSVSAGHALPKEEIVEPVVDVSISITSKDLREEIVGITNKGNESVSLQGWQLFSIEGNQVFKFPNISLAVGKTIYITSGPDAVEGQGYIKWNNGQMWKNDGDAAQLLNEKGEIVSEME